MKKKKKIRFFLLFFFFFFYFFHRSTAVVALTFAWKNKLFFVTSASRSYSQLQLFVSDSSSLAGSKATVTPLSNDTYAEPIYFKGAIDNGVLLTIGEDLYITDGVGLKLLKSKAKGFHQHSNSVALFASNDRCKDAYSDSCLWRTDGTAAGTFYIAAQQVPSTCSGATGTIGCPCVQQGSYFHCPASGDDAPLNCYRPDFKSNVSTCLPFGVAWDKATIGIGTDAAPYNPPLGLTTNGFTYLGGIVQLIK